MFKFLSRLGDSNEREVRALQPIVDRINALEPEIQALTDAELAGKTDELRARLRDELGDSSCRSSCARPIPTRTRPSRRWPAPMPPAWPTSSSSSASAS